MEALVEELIRLHPISPTFRLIFKSEQTTEMFLDAYKSFTTGVKSLPEISHNVVALMDKLSHFALALAMDSSVATVQKQEVWLVISFTAKCLTISSCLMPSVWPKLHLTLIHRPPRLTPNLSRDASSVGRNFRRPG